MLNTVDNWRRSITGQAARLQRLRTVEQDRRQASGTVFMLLTSAQNTDTEELLFHTGHEAGSLSANYITGSLSKYDS